MNEGWTVLGVFNSVNGQKKVIARKGSWVVHADRVPVDEVDKIDFDRLWAGRMMR